MIPKEAQKQYPDAIQAKMNHLPYCMTENELQRIGEHGCFGKEVTHKVLFVKVGKCVSSVIFSRQAYLDELNRGEK